MTIQMITDFFIMLVMLSTIFKKTPGSWEDLAIGWFNSIQRPDFYLTFLKFNNIYYTYNDNAESEANIIEEEQDFLGLKEGEGGLIFN